MKKLFTTTILLLLIFSISAVVGCTNSNVEDGTTTTTTEKEKATTVEITTEEVTTEEPTTVPGKFITTFAVWEEHLSYFENLTIEKGYVFSLNEIVPDPDGDVKRGIYASQITDIGLNSVGSRVELQEMYLNVGGSNTRIPYEDNFCIEYQGEKKIIFQFEKKGFGQYIFNVYAVD